MKILLFILSLFIAPIKAFSNPACAVCTIAIGTSLGLAKKLGISDSIIGLWSGALLTLVGYWSILFFDKKNWKFRYRDLLLIFISVSMIGFIYIKDAVYSLRVILYFLYLDPILFSAIIGSLSFIFTQKLYQYMKLKNNGHAHFPFEKVVLPLVLLIILSFTFYFINF